MKLTFLAAACLFVAVALLAPPASAEGLSVPTLLDRTLKFFANGKAAKQPLKRELYVDPCIIGGWASGGCKFISTSKGPNNNGPC